MGFLKDIVSIAAPIVGAIGGPVGGAIGSAIGGAVAGSGQASAANQATAEQLAAIQEAQDEVRAGVESSQALFDPLAQVGQRGIDLAGFLADPQAQAELAFNNPLFQLSREALTQDINQSAAARGRLTAGDTLTQLQNAGAIAAQPFIDTQRQDILNLLNIAGTTAGQQANIEQLGTQQLVDLITGGGATQAAGTIAAQNAETAQLGNLFDLGTALAGNEDVQGFVGGLFGGNSVTPPIPGFGG